MGTLKTFICEVHVKKLLLIIGLATVLTGCATPIPQAPIAESGKSRPYTTNHSETLNNTDHMLKHVNEQKTILYFQNFGGSVGLGLLFGPLGVAANMGMINSNTEKDVAALHGKINLAPENLFETAAKKINLVLKDGSSDLTQFPNVSPYITLVKGDDGRLYITGSMVIEFEAEKDKKWKGTYSYQLPIRYTAEQLVSAEPDTLAALEENLVNGYIELIKFHHDETLEKVAAAEKTITFKSDLLMPRFSAALQGQLAAETADRVWVRLPLAVHSLLKSDLIILSVETKTK